MINKYQQKICLAIVAIVYLFVFNIAVASKNLVKLQDVVVKNLADSDSVQVTLKFSGMPRIPANFVMDSPPELVFDFSDTLNYLTKEKLFQKLSFNLVKSINFVNHNNKVRMVIALNTIVPYISEVSGNDLILTIKNEAYQASNSKDKYDISALDFHRGNDGEGRLTLDVKSSLMNVDFKDGENGEMQVEFKGASIADQLLRKFDVSDFGTPIKNITVTKEKNNILVRILAQGDYEKISYQVGDKYIVEARPMSKSEKEIEKSRKFKFTGEKISLNFQEIEIRAVLQLLADFTGLNIVANESVQGSVTLRLDNIPWDQALDFILKSKGLGKRESGNVVLIAPTTELSKYEEVELAAMKQLEALEPLSSEFLQINYAKADDMVKMIKGDKNSSILSERGSITVDSRTNTILVKDISSRIVDMKELIKTLDVPVKQVLIEAYIVQCSENFEDMLGIKLNGAARASLGGGRKIGFGSGKSDAGSSGSSSSGSSSAAASAIPGTVLNINNSSTTAAAAATTTTSSSASTAAGAAQSLLSVPPSSNTGQFFNLGAGGAGILGLALSRLPGGTILNMEIDAGEVEGMSTTVSKPRILTLDNKSATIESGANIPYTTPGSTGYAGTTSFQKATLNLTVTPQITPNDQISMDLSISNDGVDKASNASTPTINTTSLKTNILVDNGETIVLGGIIKEGVTDNKTKIPYFSEIPFIGRLFQNKSIANTKTETLVFITPRIVQSLTKDKDK